jgi:hypothetical protein
MVQIRKWTGERRTEAEDGGGTMAGGRRSDLWIELQRGVVCLVVYGVGHRGGSTRWSEEMVGDGWSPRRGRRWLETYGYGRRLVYGQKRSVPLQKPLVEGFFI